MINGKKIGLALGGGAAKGFAHIGVLKVLEQNGIVPDIIVGTSMGSTMGGLYASGMDLKVLESEALKFKLKNIVDINAFKILKEGMIAGKKFIRFIDKYVHNAKIENFPIQYACVTCDILTGNQFVIKTGKFSVATRCSSSMPGFFAPYKMKDKLLIDGGVLNNIPADVVYDMGADYIISVDCIGDCYLIGKTTNMIDILMSSFGVTQYRYEKLRKNRANTKIVINNKKYGFFDHTPEAIKETIELGEKVTNKKINKIKKDLGLKWYAYIDVLNIKRFILK